MDFVWRLQDIRRAPNEDGLKHIPHHLTARHQAATARFFDLQHLQHASAKFALYLLNRAGRRAGERNESTGASVMAPRPSAHFLHDLPQRFAGLGAPGGAH